MATALRWRAADLELLPEDDKRYEVIDGDLHVSTQPSWEHQLAGTSAVAILRAWSLRTGAGLPNIAPGVILAEDTAVAPDVVWVSTERLPSILAADGKLYGAPDLAVEILSPGTKNEQRDREAKLRAYSQFGVREYWIVDWRRREVQVYRRDHAALVLVETLLSADELTSPLLPGFTVKVEQFFVGIRSA